MTVVLLRHGETEWSLSGRHTGTTDIPLTDDGVVQARSARDRLPTTDFAHVLVSPRIRAQETARLVGIADGAVTEPDLVEWDYGDYEGRTTDDIHTERPDWYLWEDGCPGGESPDEVAERVDRLLERVEALRADGAVALVAHGHVLRAVGARWLRSPIELGGRLKLGTAAVCELSTDHDRRAIEVWNRAA